MSELTKFNYETFKEEPLPGTEGWVEVAALDDGRGDYEWSDFKAFYSPSARRYFWHGDSGCSCNGWGDDVSSAASFEDGDRPALLRAWETFAKEHFFNTGVYVSGVATLRNFKGPKNV